MFIFYPISILYGFIVFIREELYRIGIFKSYKFKTKIVSIGNLTFGGTGKTPVVDFLLSNLKSKKRIAVISRGYGRKSSGFFEVKAAESDAAGKYGDEPVLLAKKHPEVSFFVSEDRVSGCREIESKSKFDLIIADDAFQHLKLKRDLDIIVIDATEKLTNYNYPPVGRARNSFSYLKRAQYIFLTKTNLCKYEDLQKIKSKLSGYNVIEFESEIDAFYDLRQDVQIDILLKEAFLLSGIGKPKTFETLISKKFPLLNIKNHFVYRDHHTYSDKDISEIKEKSNKLTVITTEKDAVKLKKYSSDINICVAGLKFVNKNSMDKVFSEILH